MKFGVLSAVLVLVTTMLSTIDLSQNFVFAQNSEDNSDNESTDSIGSDANDNDSVDNALSSNDNGDSQQDTSTSEEEEETDDDGFERTNPLWDQIRNNVSQTLAASGIAGQ